ncbi:unknown [Clostridium sp. CAG:524]|jgi:23S rRNA G2069 N7-methylase RlmK/C1962 C5-methylase RlmI|nr:unknown [Clostridium sp. CAG:524]
MRYVIEHKGEEKKLTYHNVKIVGLSVTPKNNVKDLTIKADKIILIDPNLCETYIRRRINKKIDKVIKFMIKILNDEDTTDGDAGLVLDEVNKLKGIIINKYKEYMLESEYKTLLTKLILIEEEFKRNYNNKLYNTYGNNIYYEEEFSEGRSR